MKTKKKTAYPAHLAKARPKQIGAAAPWAKGRPRNEVQPPTGYRSVKHLLDTVERQFRIRGEMTNLAKALGVTRKTVETWVITREKTPTQERIDQMAKWLELAPR